MKKGITIKDIAKKLNMSISTVSKALNNDLTISVLTKERVQNLANELNYVPNESARNFKLNKSFTIGLIIPELLDQFYVLAINGVEAVAEEHNYNVILAQSNEEIKKEENITNLMIRNRVDGVIVAITKSTADMMLFKKLETIGIPVVFVARAPNDPSFNHVTSDNEGGAYNATEFLIKKGHKRIAHLMGPRSMQISIERLESYKTALLKNNFPVDTALIKEVDFTRHSTNTAMHQLMSLPDPPTAIFAFKTYITLDAIEFLKQNFPKKIGQIDFVGFGNLPLLHYLDHKPIASIEESSFEMGSEAARLLFNIINQQDEEQVPLSKHIKIPCRLIEY